MNRNYGHHRYWYIVSTSTLSWWDVGQAVEIYPTEKPKTKWWTNQDEPYDNRPFSVLKEQDVIYGITPLEGGSGRGEKVQVATRDLFSTFREAHTESLNRGHSYYKQDLVGERVIDHIDSRNRQYCVDGEDHLGNKL